MKVGIYSIYDAKAQAYGQPFFSPRNGTAIRAFTDEVNRADERNPFYKHPDDYSLFHMGDWDDAGEIVPNSTPVLLSTANNVKEK